MNARIRNYVRYAWGVLVWNVFVVVWGAFVRASGSGAGCGEHWPLCNGAAVPPSPTMATVIEFTHRLTSGAALIGVLGLVVWGVRLFPKGHRARRAAWASLGFILLEAMLGAGLVLLSYVEKNTSAGRAAYLSAHLINTLLLLAAITCTAWFAQAMRSGMGRVPGILWAALGIALLTGVTGVIAALGDTIYPAASLAEGVRQEFSDAAPALLRLRLLHPVVASSAGFFLLLTAFTALSGRAKSWLAALTLVQLAAGALDVMLLAPVWLQLLHLALASCVWITLVLAALEKSAPAEHI